MGFNSAFKGLNNSVMTSSPLWDVSQPLFVAICRHFGTTNCSHLQGFSFSRRFALGLLDPGRWEKIGCPETSGNSYKLTLRNSPEERRFHLHGGGSLKSRNSIMLKITGHTTENYPRIYIRDLINTPKSLPQTASWRGGHIRQFNPNGIL